MKEDSEICTICGVSVKFSSGNYVNRGPDINDFGTKLVQKKPFPHGQFICAECNEKDSARRDSGKCNSFIRV
jgi:hypothetical protein